MSSAAKKTKPAKIDWEDAESLVHYIEDHAVFVRDAITKKDKRQLLNQAEEIEGWAQSLVRVARGEKR